MADPYQKPSIGRIVHYQPPHGDFKQRPAIITGVAGADDEAVQIVDLTVFDPHSPGGTYVATAVPEDRSSGSVATAGHWHWPESV